MTEHDAYFAGWDAHRAGTPFTANPFDHEEQPAHFDAWARGHEDADEWTEVAE